VEIEDESFFGYFESKKYEVVLLKEVAVKSFSS